MLQPIATRAPDFVPDQITDEEGGAMLRAALNLFGKWEVTDEEAAKAARSAGPYIPTLESWLQPGRLDRDMKARLVQPPGHPQQRLRIAHWAFRLSRAEPMTWIKAPNALAI